MKTKYKIREVEIPNIGKHFEVFSERFCIEDLYEIVGESEYVVTIAFREGSGSEKKYKSMITGVFRYSMKERKEIKECICNHKTFSGTKQKFKPLDLNIEKELATELSKIGFPIEDLIYISFMPYTFTNRYSEKIENKTIPTIEIPFDGWDDDTTYKIKRNFTIQKNNKGYELIPEEKAYLIGTLLAENQKSIDSRILAHFEYTQEKASKDIRVWMYYHEAMKMLEPDNQVHISNYFECKKIVQMQKIQSIFEEVGKQPKLNEDDIKRLLEFIDLMKDFTPSVLLHVKPQIFWDEKTLSHLCLRHSKEFQIGKFRQKTTFSYTYSDLKALLERVLDESKDAIEIHFSRDSGKKFFRNWEMATYYNGDYYCIEIDKYRRVIQFHQY